MIENSPHSVGRLTLDVTFLEEEDDEEEEEEEGEGEVLTNPDFAESDDQENITINVSGNLPSKEGRCTLRMKGDLGEVKFSTWNVMMTVS